MSAWEKRKMREESNRKKRGSRGTHSNSQSEESQQSPVGSFREETSDFGGNFGYDLKPKSYNKYGDPVYWWARTIDLSHLAHRRSDLLNRTFNFMVDIVRGRKPFKKTSLASISPERYWCCKYKIRLANSLAVAIFFWDFMKINCWIWIWIKVNLGTGTVWTDSACVAKFCWKASSVLQPVSIVLLLHQWFGAHNDEFMDLCHTGDLDDPTYHCCNSNW